MKKIIIFLLVFFAGFLIFTLSYFLLDDDINIGNIDSYAVYVESTDDTMISNGSGFVYKTDDNYNYIITNYHVILDSDKIKVYNSKNEQTDAELFGYDELSDIAILKINNDLNLKSVNIANSDKLKLGDFVFVVGTPVSKDYSPTVTHGIVSYLNREIKIETKVGLSKLKTIQIDASINEGNSGGALINKDGKVVGVVFIKEEDGIGIGFALPINYVMNIVRKIENSIE